MTYRDGRDRRATEETNSTWGWVAGALGAIILVAAIVWAYTGGISEQAGKSANSNGLTGQSTSSSGSTTVGASAGTKPKETSGQTSTPAGTTTTGAQK